jgi:hypothetical protein
VHRLGGGRLEETLPHIIYTLMSILGDTTLEVESATFSKLTPYEWVVADTVLVSLKGARGTASIYLSFGVEHNHITFATYGTRGNLEACLDTRLVERSGLKYHNTGKRDPLERLIRLLDGVSNRLLASVSLSKRTLRPRRRPDWLMSEVVRSLEEGRPMPVSLDEAIATVRITREICDRMPAAIP